MSSAFEQLTSDLAYEAGIFSVHKRTYRHEDGKEVTREIVEHSGAVGVVVHDGERVWLVRQPREAVGIPDLLEIPAGRLDQDGEAPLDAAKRELAEEIGKAADHWEHLTTFFTTPGFADEAVHLYLATGLSEADVEPIASERIDIVTHPLADLDALLDQVTDSKTLIGLYALRRRLG